MVMPYHVLLDTAGEAKLGKLSIGTTRRGIGPCYADKAARLGIRVQDLLDAKILRKKIMAAMEPKSQALRPYAKDPELDLHAMTEEYLTYGHRLEPHIADTARLCWELLDRGDTVLFEGAQGTMLDLDHGTYPFVTSSNPSRERPASARASGPRTSTRSGASRRHTRRASGRGRFPPELDDDVGRRLLERGHEYGTTTGRERRCGWLDLVALRYAVRLNRMTALTLTKLDVLGGLDPLRVAVRYRHPEGAVFDEFPYHQSILHTRGGRLRGAARLRRRLGDCRREADLPARGARLHRVHQRLRRRAGHAWSASAPAATRSSGWARPSRGCAPREEVRRLVVRHTQGSNGAGGDLRDRRDRAAARPGWQAGQVRRPGGPSRARAGTGCRAEHRVQRAFHQGRQEAQAEDRVPAQGAKRL